MTDPRVSPLLHRLGGLYRDPSRVDRDASGLLRSSVGKHLRPEIANLVENNGDTHNTLCLKGTIAIHYRGQTYQQLVDVHFPEGYPVRPPTIFVRLAPNMYVKDGHPHVGSDGKVYLPYLHEWRAHSHNMVELIVAMSSVFSADPPVFSRPKKAKAKKAPKPADPPPPSYDDSMAAALRASQKEAEERAAREAEEANRISSLARKAEEEEERKQAEEERQRAAQEAWDAKLFGDKKTKVKNKVSKYLKELSRDTKASLQADWQDQRSLQTSSSRLKEQLNFMEKTKGELEDSVAKVTQATAELQEWIEQQESAKKDETEKVDVDSLVTPDNKVHEQMLELSSENHALTDALYFLDNALHRQTLGMSEHLKEVRRLAKRQFLVRAHLIKISQTLMYRPEI
uniref:UEV domain-containing protein n=1 Tax=Grammatophora oceanica TaxID=210454 RepID=A0A7S1URT0_9STRA|mmetsp:Transcript_19578/g.28974  ORF Transcript_19578/g.28974 Transcript_19578/m.28974 type:complete len:399 (+) Transcript_19578:50-1246(+)|eukprot:CAMPEP_0194031980 /NCGR_PEP_ID=MMETSP0009_2-20130614/5028_1 /TAXON_ID=210454 /ORGANISM="Grammatophora oceanica, Strain CCMP 410" /LENGTH=398 /DNA_ID=CAMNT_0038672287 /DNA_START=40 /DNA_END=1236 /DNA_ORIENTATION=-